tara:strand:- start:89 stop:583 length:495 start_codon:yes stop_codon:yes gene_type:complete
MKKTILILAILLPTLIYSQKRKFYGEVNLGMSTTVNYEDEVVDIVDMSVTYEDNIRPTASLLFGANIDMGDYSLIDVQLGLSYPYIVTGKIGVGSYYGKDEQYSFVIGCRPYPLAGYGQLSIRPNTGWQIVLSGEIGTGADISLGTRSLFNLGLRLPIKFKGTK